MFALIETKGATHIAISIPKEGADKSLQALANMLEYNATFIRKGWREMELVTPAMSITLGDTFRTEDSEAGEMVIKTSTEVLDEDFAICSPLVLVSNKKVLAKKDEEIKRLQTELAHVKEQLRAATTRESED